MKVTTNQVSIVHDIFIKKGYRRSTVTEPNGVLRYWEYFKHVNRRELGSDRWEADYMFSIRLWNWTRFPNAIKDQGEYSIGTVTLKVIRDSRVILEITNFDQNHEYLPRVYPTHHADFSPQRLYKYIAKCERRAQALFTACKTIINA